ncbi:hypothetical protein K502DRAFT_323628 [Neoconidiobolus thromboides FSU 785]|nr:hypothetical protein K502DRAFT_323628 [Neoconidiobolus thromboides FSU 785]
MDSMEIGSPEVGSMNSHGSGTSVLGTYYNIVCVTAGIGILGLPSAVAAGGWVSIVFIFLAGLISTYTGTLVIKCLYCRSDYKLETYSQIGREAFGWPGKLIVQICHYTIILGSGCLCIMLTGINAESIAAANGVDIGLKLWILIAGVVVAIPYCILRKMKEFVWMAIFGFATTLVVLIIVMVQSIIDVTKLPIAPNRDPVVWSGIPLALTTFSISYAGNVVYPHLEGSMQNPKKWPVALAAGLGTVTIFYLCMAVFGYYAYGTGSQSPIFGNLPDNAANLSAKILIIIHVLMAAPIILCSFGLELEEILSITPERMGPVKALVLRVSTRLVTIVCLVLISMYVPFFQDFMSIIGAIFNCLIVFLIPIACNFKLFGIRNRPIWEYVIATITIIIGIVCLILGAIDSVKSLIRSFQHAYQN